MNKTIILGAVMTLGLVISGITLALSPPITFFEVQRDRKVISLDVHQSMPVLTHYTGNINRIVIDLTQGDSFIIIYQISTDYPTDIVNQTYQTNHLTLNYDSLKLFTINSTTQPIQGYVEIDYGILA